MAAGLPQEQLQGVGRRLDRRQNDGWAFDGFRLDDLDAALVELPDERLVLEPGQLVRFDDVVHLRRADRAPLLARVEQRPELLLGQQTFDVDGGHGGIEGTDRATAALYEVPTVGRRPQPLFRSNATGAGPNPP